MIENFMKIHPVDIVVLAKVDIWTTDWHFQPRSRAATMTDNPVASLVVSSSHVYTNYSYFYIKKPNYFPEHQVECCPSSQESLWLIT